MSKIGNFGRYLINPVGKGLAIGTGACTMGLLIMLGSQKLGEITSGGYLPESAHEINYNNDSIPDLVLKNSKGRRIGYMVGDGDGDYTFIDTAECR